MASFLIGIDVGTTGVKVALFATDGTLVASAYEPHDSAYPSDGYVEQRPDDWFNGSVAGLKSVLSESGIDSGDVAGISFSGQMMGQVPISKDGDLLLESVPIWADQRAGDQAARLLDRVGGHEAFYNITYMGHPVQMTSVPRIMWFMDHQPDLVAKAHKWLHSKEYLLYRLTGALATDPTDQCLGSGFDLAAGTHSQTVLEAAGLTADVFPDLHESTDVVGHVSAEAAAATGLKAGTPVAVGGGDGPCAAAGSTALAEGDAYFNLGSPLWGGTIETKPFGDFDSKMICYRHVIPGRYHSQYVSFTGAIGQQWYIETAYSELEGATAYEQALKEAGELPPDNTLPVFLPFLRPGGAPHQHDNASGVFHGVRVEHNRAHLYKAVLQGISHSLHQLYEDVSRVTGRSIGELAVVGGGAMNPMLMQMVSDGLSLPVNLLANQDSNCLGAALCAGLGVGVWSDADAAKASGIFHQQGQHLPGTVDRDKVDAAYRRYRASMDIAQQLWSLA